MLERYPPEINHEGWPRLVRQLAADGGFAVADIDFVIFTQVRKPTIELVMHDLGLPMDKTHTVMEKWGYTGSACIAMAFDDAREQGKIGKGDLVAFVAPAWATTRPAPPSAWSSLRVAVPRAAKILLALAAALLLAGAAAGAVCWKKPLATLAWIGRRRLSSSGFEKHVRPSAVGPQVVFAGGGGAPVVLVHGAGDQAGGWSRVAPRLAKSFAVVAVDLAGHGGSAPAEGPLPFATLLAGFDGAREPPRRARSRSSATPSAPGSRPCGRRSIPIASSASFS